MTEIERTYQNVPESEVRPMLENVMICLVFETLREIQVQAGERSILAKLDNEIEVAVRPSILDILLPSAFVEQIRYIRTQVSRIPFFDESEIYEFNFGNCPTFKALLDIANDLEDTYKGGTEREQRETLLLDIATIALMRNFFLSLRIRALQAIERKWADFELSHMTFTEGHKFMNVLGDIGLLSQGGGCVVNPKLGLAGMLCSVGSKLIDMSFSAQRVVNIATLKRGSGGELAISTFYILNIPVDVFDSILTGFTREACKVTEFDVALFHVATYLAKVIEYADRVPIILSTRVNYPVRYEDEGDGQVLELNLLK